MALPGNFQEADFSAIGGSAALQALGWSTGVKLRTYEKPLCDLPLVIYPELFVREYSPSRLYGPFCGANVWALGFLSYKRGGPEGTKPAE